MKQFKSPIDAFLHWESSTPDQLFLKQPMQGKLHEWTYKSGGEEIRRMATALQSFGFEKGSKIAILSKNCAHWIMGDLAIMMAGYVSVPIYPTLGADDIRLILEHSESSAVIAGKLDFWDRQKPGIPDIPIIGIEGFDLTDTYTWEGLVKEHAPMETPVAMDPDDLITLIYTSGTTGVPKGVMHTVSTFAFVTNTFVDVVRLPPHPRMFSYLPLSHVAERIGISMQGIWRGASIRFPHSIDTFPADLADTSPNLFFAVPRIWSKFQDKILEKMPEKKLNLFLKIPILKGIVKKKIQKALGLSDTHFIASGAAPIAPSLVEWFRKLDIEILQGYGMTEDCILSHFNLPGHHKLGTVGRAFPVVDARVSKEGEIQLKSGAVMKGYYKMPEITAETFTKDGYLRTGDMGEYDKEGYLTITGRFKDQFKTDKGKYVTPMPIELEMSKNHKIGQICLVGTGIPQPIAMITLSEEAQDDSFEEIRESLEATLASVNPTLAKHERIAKLVIMKEDWTVENDLATPSLKIKRNALEKIYRDRYADWYGMEGKVIRE